MQDNQALSLHIDALNQGAQQVEQIMQTIGSIAEQTNLLALNAATGYDMNKGQRFCGCGDEVRAGTTHLKQPPTGMSAKSFNRFLYGGVMCAWHRNVPNK